MIDMSTATSPDPQQGAISPGNSNRIPNLPQSESFSRPLKAV
jgi:hypothetical protein